MSDSLDNRISIHHVGGRDGHGSFPILSRFQRDLVFTFYDADPDCVEQIKERNQYLQSEVHVLPYCLGRGSGEATLFINYDPYTSSLLLANPYYRDYRSLTNYGAFGKDFDYVIGEALRPMEKRLVSTVGLDELVSTGRLTSDAPDFLSIDTQGSEYDILTGARQALQKNILALTLEVEFHPMYSGQKLFGDISNLLASQGFLFVRFSRAVGPFTPYRSPITLRGSGIQLHEDALFIRSVESLSNDQDKRRHCLMLHKLAFMAVVFDQVEMAAECLRLVEASDAAGAVRSELASLEYGRFLADFWSAVKRQPAFFPATFASEFTFETSRSRFTTAKQRGVRWIELIRDWCVRKQARWQTLKRLLHPISSTYRRVALLLKLTIDGKAFWRHPALQWRTGVERVLRRYGLCDQEKIVKRNRWQHSPFCEESPAATPSNEEPV
jgi:FkbM family methyltransferase